MTLSHEIFFKMLADETRLRALILIQDEGELCVCELTHALDLSQPKMSRHLAQLRKAELVSTRRDGLWMYYQINSSLPEWGKNILNSALEGLAKKPIFKSDRQRLKAMANRPEVSCCA